MRILIVDDYKMTRFLVSKILADLEIEDIQEAAHGKEALLKLTEAAEASQPVDVIFTDWNMPVMDGVELLKAAKADSRLQKSVFVMITANTNDAEIKKAKEHGFFDLITKPFNPGHIQKILDRVKEQKQAS